MKTAPLLGVILIILGALALAYQGITYTTHKKVLVSARCKRPRVHKTIPAAPDSRAIALIGGVVLLVAGRKSSLAVGSAI